MLLLFTESLSILLIVGDEAALQAGTAICTWLGIELNSRPTNTSQPISSAPKKLKHVRRSRTINRVITIDPGAKLDLCAIR